MKILEINKFYHPWIGGVETIVRQIAEDLNGRDGLTVDVLACQSKGPRTIETANGVKVYRAASWGKRLGMPISFDFFRLLRQIERNYDILLFHFPFPLAALVIPCLKNKNIYILYHSDIVRQKISRCFFQPFIATSLKRAKKILASSQNLASHSPALRKHQDRVRIIPFGIDLDYFRINDKVAAEAERIRNEYPRPLLLAIGRLVYYKGYSYLIKALEKIDAHLVIIGTGPQETELRALTKLYWQEKKITILPPRDDLRPYYAACDLFIFPSVANSEAFGLVQAEAMAFGKAVINTDLPTGVPEVSLDGTSGLTVPPGDSSALAGAINRLLGDQGLKNRLGQAAQERAKALFDRRIFNEKLITSLTE